MTRTRKVLILTVVSMMCSLAIIAGTQASANVYLGGGTVVFKREGAAPDADKGVTVCHEDSGLGIGGGCLPFPSGQDGAVAVSGLLGDGLNIGSPNVAFQVCIDNDGDSRCTSGGRKAEQPPVPDCSDTVFFSHNDKGDFFNPLGPLPTSLKEGCNPETGWKGYVVFICEGVHVENRSPGTNSPTPHSHPTTSGTIDLAPTGFGAGLGDFCGGTLEQVVEKDYVVIS